MAVFGNLSKMELTRTVEDRIGCLIERIPFYHIPVPEQNRRPCRSGFHDLVLAVLLEKGVLHRVMNVSFYTQSQYQVGAADTQSCKVRFSSQLRLLPVYESKDQPQQ